ncbi:MAG: pitrilysin family protein [Erysipelotrichaceae bacterium]
MEKFTHFGRFHLLKTEKFKDITCSLRLLGPNEEPFVSMRSLLAQILIDRSEHYPQKSDITAKCDACYGLSIDTKTTAYGMAHGLELRFKTISDRYADDKPFEKALAFVADLLQYPLISEATLAEAKTNVLAALLRYADNPSQYAMIKACSLAGEGTPLAVFSQGKREVVEEITVTQLADYYASQLSKARFDMFVVGDFDEKNMLKQLREKFAFLVESNDIDSAYANRISVFKSGHIERAIEQANLVRLYSIHTDVYDPHYTANRLAVVMLGQLPNSLLFREVREARSLCYSIYSGMIQFDGIVSVSTGIDMAKRFEVETLIEEQLDLLKNNKFDPTLLKTAQDMMISSLKSAQDDISSLINFYHQRALTTSADTMDSTRDKILAVQCEDIAHAVSNWKPIVSFTVGAEEKL